MIKRGKQTAPTPKGKSLNVVNTNSVIISRNKNGRKVKTEKKYSSSPTTNTDTIALPRLKNCVLKLKRFKMPQLSSVPDLLNGASIASSKIATITHKSAKNCRVHLSRVRHSTEQDSLVQASAVDNSPPITHGLRNEKNENSETCVKADIKAEAFKKPKCEKLNDIENNRNPMKYFDAAMKSSTPLKPAAPLQREPFKVLNLQEVIREVDPPDHAPQTFKNQPIITKENRECLRKLSLSRTKNPQKLAKQNKIVRFEPLRNSTFYAVDIPTNTVESLLMTNRLDDTATEPEENVETVNVDKSAENSQEKSQGYSKNLANRSDLIEQLLLSDNDEEQSTANRKPPQNETTVASKTNKFFHRTLENSRNPNNTVMKQINPVKKTRISHKRRLTRRGKCSVGSVYEFLSQSQTDSDSGTTTKKLDPAADVIKKLIAEGKARLAVRKKGTGKLIIKRKNIPKKRAVVQRRKNTKKNIKKVSKDNEPYVDSDHMHYDALEEPEIPNEPVQPFEEDATIPASKKNHDTSTCGDTFSNLARSVLISETKKKENSRKKITYQRKLLEAAQKFVSTPVRKVYPPLDKTANMSIISQGAARSEDNGAASPWRVDDDAHLPSTFYFSRNSANLPSFSSDYIPSSPRKQKHRYQDLLPEPESELPLPTTPLNDVADAQLPMIPTIGAELSSSLSSNDSNAENKPPPASKTNPATSGSENLNFINQRQQLNPRRELSYRSPLQILDVITLPPWNSSKQQYTIEKKDRKTSNNNTTLPNQQTKGNISDLFGFEEFLTDDITEDDQQMRGEVAENLDNSSFRNKLHDLKHLRPAQKEIPQSSSNHKADVFDDVTGQSGSKQLQIKEMLCSTMINNGKGKEAMNMKEKVKFNEEYAGAKKMTNEPPELFIDPDPGASFNEKDSHRTYGRPYKRKRKLRHNFVMFLDSDESGDDDEANQKYDIETSKELEVEHKKKKHKKEQKNKVELNSFLNEFNDMCKEVDNYELIIE